MKMLKTLQASFLQVLPFFTWLRVARPSERERTVSRFLKILAAINEKLRI